MRLNFRLGWHEFFAPDGYPFSLDHVEARDDTAGQVRFVSMLLPHPPARVVDLGSGNGRHARRLARLGYEVTAVDRFAQESTEYLACIAELDQLPLKDETFDGCISLYTSAGYGSRSMNSQFSEWLRVTRPAGTLVLDIANRGRRFRTAVDDFSSGRGFMWSVRVGGRRLQVNLAVVDRSATFFAFTYPEPRLHILRKRLEECGWLVVDLYGDFDGSPLDRSTPRMIVRALRA